MLFLPLLFVCLFSLLGSWENLLNVYLAFLLPVFGLCLFCFIFSLFYLNGTNGMPSPIIATANRHLRRLERSAATATRALQRKYATARDTLLSRVNRLEDAMVKQPLTHTELTQLNEFGQLFNSVETQLGPVGRRLSTASQAINSEAVGEGLSAGAKMGSLAAGSEAILSPFLIPGSTIFQASSLVSVNSPLFVRLSTLYGPDWAVFISSQFVSGVVNGWNPRRIANTIRQTVTIAIPADMERIIRTAQLYAYREAQRNTWISSGVVDFWVWYAALDGRTCGSCWNNHGQQFPVTDMLNDHHNGRCTAIPHTIALPNFPARDLGIADGESIFNGLSPSAQEAMATAGNWGPQFRAYRAGAIDFSQMSRPYEDRTYGVMQAQASLVSILGEGAEEFYAR